MNPEIQALFEAARKSRKNSYSPYSQYAVGAALRNQSGEIFSGCNVENGSFGATLCAERSAIVHMVSHSGFEIISEILVLTEDLAPPCGMCLQFLSEFADEKTQVYLSNEKGECLSRPLLEFLPYQYKNKKLYPKYESRHIIKDESTKKTSPS